MLISHPQRNTLTTAAVTSISESLLQFQICSAPPPFSQLYNLQTTEPLILCNLKNPNLHFLIFFDPLRVKLYSICTSTIIIEWVSFILRDLPNSSSTSISEFTLFLAAIPDFKANFGRNETYCYCSSYSYYNGFVFDINFIGRFGGLYKSTSN